MVCVCINEMALLLPACVKCSECFVPEEPVKIPPNPRQFPSTTVAPIPPRPEPYPEPQGTKLFTVQTIFLVVSQGWEWPKIFKDRATILLS